MSLLGFLLLTSCLEEMEERSPYPDIKFGSTVYDFGEIAQGAKVEYSYEFKNGGSDTLRITKVRKGCGCQSAEATKKVIPPGQKGSIKVIFNSTGYSGNVTKTVYVHSNDPEEEKVNLVMKGTVLVDLVVRPRSLNFRDVSIGKSASKKVHIMPVELETLEIKNIEVSADYITVSTSDHTEGTKKGVELTVILGPDVPVSTIVEKITVSTNSKKQPLIQIPVYARVSDKITIEPRVLHIRIKPGESKKYTISVFKADRRDFKITKVEDNLEDIETEFSFLREAGDRQNYEIKIDVKPTASPGSLKGLLTFHTNDAKQSTIGMRVSGVIE